MKVLISFLVVSLVSLVSAQAKDSYVQGFLGFDATAINFGVDYEVRKSESHGVGGYFLFSGEEDSGASAQTISFGGMLRLRIHETEKFEVSMAPGFGITMVEGSPDDETVLGPTMKLGVMYKTSDKNAIGVEVFQAYNWLNSDTFGTIPLQYFNFSYRIKL